MKNFVLLGRLASSCGFLGLLVVACVVGQETGASGPGERRFVAFAKQEGGLDSDASLAPEAELAPDAEQAQATSTPDPSSPVQIPIQVPLPAVATRAHRHTAAGRG